MHCSARTLRTLPRPGEAAGAGDRDAGPRGRDPALRLSRASPNATGSGCCRRVQGVGAKLALAILGVLTPAELASAIALQDKAMVARAPGVGARLATRIVTELKDKAPAFAAVDLGVVRLAGGDGAKPARGPVEDAISALVNLGYGRPQAAAAVAASLAALGEAAETSALIRRGLRELAQ